MKGFDLEAASGWREVEPRADGPQLLVEREGNLFQIRSDGSEVHAFGAVGPVDCPLAIDPAAGVAYRYVSQARFGRRDFSELRAFDLRSGASRTLSRLGLNRWVLWMLEWIEGKAPGDGGVLFGLLATDVRSEDRLEIRHQLFAMNPADGQLRLRPVCRDAYFPLAMSRARREILFSGAEGIYIVGLKGERLASWGDGERPTGRGGAFDPAGGRRVALGGAGLFLWDYERGRHERLTRQGQYPVWAKDGRTIWFSESSSDLFAYDLERRRAEPIVKIRDNRNPEISFARPVKQSGDGRYLALPISGKRLMGVKKDPLDSGQRERVYQNFHTFCIFDLKTREFWVKERFVPNFCWIDEYQIDLFVTL